MKSLFVRALVVASFSVAAPFAKSQALSPVTNAELRLRDAVECTVREGLPNFFAKLAAGKPVKIAYLGGSITAQNGWRVQSRAWFQKGYPRAVVTEVNAAIGGTGSDLGVFRVEQDVLNAKPDLLLVEFAVNDDGVNPVEIRRAMEGIVRKTWRALPECEIGFVYTVTANTLAKMSAGKTTRAQDAMEEVAEHYGIASINFGVTVGRLEREGKLLMTSSVTPVARVSGDELDAAAPVQTDAQGRILFSTDGVHPFPETGHVLYTQILIRAMDQIRPIGQTRVHTIKAPLADNLESAKILALDSATLMAAGAIALDPAKDKLAASFAAQLPALWKLPPGTTLRIRFTGTRAAFYDLLGPDCGELEVSLDGITRTMRRIDGYSTYHRLGAWNLGDQLQNKEHEVVVRVLPTVLDKRAIILEQRRSDVDKNPANYVGANWYVGALLVAGPAK